MIKTKIKTLMTIYKKQSNETKEHSKITENIINNAKIIFLIFFRCQSLAV